MLFASALNWRLNWAAKFEVEYQKIYLKINIKFIFLGRKLRGKWVEQTILCHFWILNLQGLIWIMTLHQKVALYPVIFPCHKIICTNIFSCQAKAKIRHYALSRHKYFDIINSFRSVPLKPVWLLSFLIWKDFCIKPFRLKHVSKLNPNLIKK